MAPPAFFLSCSIFTSSCVLVFCCTLRALAGRTHASTARPARQTPPPGIFTTSCVRVFCCILQACSCSASKAAADALKNPPLSSTGRTHASTAQPSSDAATSN